MEMVMDFGMGICLTFIGEAALLLGVVVLEDPISRFICITMSLVLLLLIISTIGDDF